MIAALCGGQSVKERISLHGFYFGRTDGGIATYVVLRRCRLKIDGCLAWFDECCAFFTSSLIVFLPLLFSYLELSPFVSSVPSFSFLLPWLLGSIS